MKVEDSKMPAVPRSEFTVHIEWLPDMKLKHSVLPVRGTLNS